MRAMLWKEIREIWKWAALALLTLTLAEFYVLSKVRREFQPNIGGLTLCDPAFLLVTTFGCAAAGAFLGTMQILPELKRDRWAALLHRPVSRGTIFWGKVCAGLLLYFVATAIPFLASTLYVAAPAVFPAPFVAGLMRPGWDDVAFGAAAYFAALLVCLQRGRWFGLRGAVVCAAALLLLLHTGGAGPAFLLSIGAAAVLALSAWGAMRNQEPIGARPWLGQAALIGVGAIGLQAVLLLAVVVLSLLTPKAEPPISVYHELMVTKEGQILRMTGKSDGSSREVTDLAGAPINDDRYVGNNSYNYLADFTPLGFNLKERTEGYYTSARSARGSGHYMQAVEANYAEKEYWYLLVQQNYFVGYDTLSRRCIGICDREGFKPAQAKPVPFPGTLHGNYADRGRPTLFWTAARVYAFAFSERRMTSFEAPGGTIYQALQIPNGFGVEKARYVLVALNTGFRLCDEQGRAVAAFPFPHDPREWKAITVGTDQAVDRLYVESSPVAYWYLAESPSALKFLDVFDLHGNLLEAYTEPKSEIYRAQPSWLKVFAAYALPAPPLLLAGYYYHRSRSSSLPASPRWQSQEDLFLPAAHWQIFLLVGLVWAACTFPLARRGGLSRRSTWAWAAFVFVAGPAGLLTCRLVSDWPVRVRCPECGSQRPISSAQCSVCHEAWAARGLTGAEIFE